MGRAVLGLTIVERWPSYRVAKSTGFTAMFTNHTYFHAIYMYMYLKLL